MSGLDALKLVASKPPKKDGLREIRRQKLCAKLDEQIDLAQRTKAGSTLESIVIKRERDPESGEVKAVERVKRIKPWWWTADDGTTCLTVRYGAKVLELAKGRSTIESEGIDGVIASLGVLKVAAQAGELDAHIERLVSKEKPIEPPGRATLSLRKHS